MYNDFTDKLTPETFELHGKTYEVYPCSAVALEAGDSEEDRQQALYVVPVGCSDGDAVVFGWNIPETSEDFASMCEDSSAWSMDCGTLETIKPLD